MLESVLTQMSQSSQLLLRAGPKLSGFFVGCLFVLLARCFVFILFWLFVLNFSLSGFPSIFLRFIVIAVELVPGECTLII